MGMVRIDELFNTLIHGDIFHSPLDSALLRFIL